MFKFLLTFGAGVYTGMYVSQNYEVPKVDDPSKIIDKIKEIADEHRKKNSSEEVVHKLSKGVKEVIN